MKPSASDMRTTLNKAKGHGPAHEGVHHWWVQRVTAVALAPLLAWFCYALLTVMLTPDPAQVALWFASPFNALLTALMLIAAFWHAKLGVQVVIEDYVHGPAAKYTLLLLNIFLCFAFAAVGILAVLRLHFLDIASGVT